MKRDCISFFLMCVKLVCKTKKNGKLDNYDDRVYHITGILQLEEALHVHVFSRKNQVKKVVQRQFLYMHNNLEGILTHSTQKEVASERSFMRKGST